MALLMLSIALLFMRVVAEPLGANATVIGNSERGALSNVTVGINATAGNVTELLLNGDQVTKYWQGFFGNVSGDIVLGNGAGQSLYRWASGTINGEIYASRNATRISWADVGCANWSQVKNEDAFINASSIDDTDSVNHTFNYTSHPSFQIGSRSISGCRSTPVNGSSALTNGYWNALLVDNQTAVMEDDIVIYTAIIDTDQIGFNGNVYDFQIIVGENGNGTEFFPNGQPTTYYFYVEIS